MVIARFISEFFSISPTCTLDAAPEFKERRKHDPARILRISGAFSEKNLIPKYESSQGGCMHH